MVVLTHKCGLLRIAMSKREALVEWVRWLEDWAGQLESLQCTDRSKSSRAGGGWAYKASCLLDCWRLSLHVRSLHGLKEAVGKSMKLVLPEPLAEAVFALPHPASKKGGECDQAAILQSLPSARGKS